MERPQPAFLAGYAVIEPNDEFADQKWHAVRKMRVHWPPPQHLDANAFRKLKSTVQYNPHRSV
jgi:hypothetical protein